MPFFVADMYIMLKGKVYFDNNATTFMSPAVCAQLSCWCNRGNASASYESARQSREMMTEFRDYMLKLCRSADAQYQIIFVSGASEANSTILRTASDAWRFAMGAVPHIVVSSIEHKSVLMAVESMRDLGLISYTLVDPTPTGHILPEAIEVAIQRDTCLIVCMSANNETGAINAIKDIGQVAHSHNIPLYVDATQSFGKFGMNPLANNVDAFCMSFHKMGGPVGVGALIIKRQFVAGWKLKPLIYGTQENNMRGGTENIAGIAASMLALKETMQDRRVKNAAMAATRDYIVSEISKHAPSITYPAYMHRVRQGVQLPAVEIVFLSGISPAYLPNTILLSVVKRTKPPMCNAELKRELENANIIVSIGSACNTSDAKASHVLYAMKADTLILKGAIRISLGDLNTVNEAKLFVRAFLSIVKKHT